MASTEEIKNSAIYYHIDERIPTILNVERRNIMIYAFAKRYCSMNIHFGDLIFNVISNYLSNTIEEGMYITKSQYFDINHIHINNMIEPNHPNLFAKKLITSSQNNNTWCYYVLIGILMFILFAILFVMIELFIWFIIFGVTFCIIIIGIFDYYKFKKKSNDSNPLCSLLKFNIEEQLIQEWIVESYNIDQYGSIIITKKEEENGKYVCKLIKIINHCQFNNLKKVYCKQPQKIQNENEKKIKYIDGYIRFIPKYPGEPSTVITKYRPYISYATEIISQLNRLNIKDVYTLIV